MSTTPRISEPANREPVKRDLSDLQLVFWRDGQRRCELWMSSGVPELRVFAAGTLIYMERAPVESLHQRAEQLRPGRTHRRFADY